MRKGERPFSATMYGKRKYKPETVAKRMLALGYCQVSRCYGHVSRVDVSDDVMIQYFIRENFGRVDSGVPSCSLESQRDYYRRCVSEDVITDVPEPIMFMIRNPGMEYVYRPPELSDEEVVEAIKELGLV